MPNKPTTLREEFAKYLERWSFTNENGNSIADMNGRRLMYLKDDDDEETDYRYVDEKIADWWLSKSDSQSTELVSKIEGMKSESTSINQAVYNRAMDEVINLINQEKKIYEKETKKRNYIPFTNNKLE